MNQIEISFDGAAPQFRPDQDLLDAQLVQQLRQLISSLVQLARCGFPFAACERVVVASDVKKQHVQQVIAGIEAECALLQQASFQFLAAVPTLILCEIIGQIKDFRPAVMAYIISLLFPEQQI